jgi:N-acetylglutamate synthase-like GNAT family acetyltransferase
MMDKEYRFGEFLLSTAKSKLNIPYIHKFLSEESYWAKGVPVEVVERSIEHALCFGVYHIGDGTENQIGFARLITDFATYGYLADVFIDEAWRKKGLSKNLTEFIFGMEEFKGFRRFMLATADAHGLYAKVGFTPLKSPERFMEKHQPDVYEKTITQHLHG